MDEELYRLAVELAEYDLWSMHEYTCKDGCELNELDFISEEEFLAKQIKHYALESMTPQQYDMSIIPF